MTNILIIDDNPDDLEFYEDMIHQIGGDYTVYTAEDADEGLALFNKHAIDCTFVDYNLPEVTGIQILETLQKTTTGKTLPVIMLTGDANQAVQAEAARKGALDFVTKSVEGNTPQKIEATIKKVIAWADDLNTKNQKHG